MLDAIDRPILIGAKYGFSRNQNGISYVTIGCAAYLKNDKVRLINCTVTSRLYGLEESKKIDQDASDISMHSFMLFPISPNLVK